MVPLVSETAGIEGVGLMELSEIWLIGGGNGAFVPPPLYEESSPEDIQTIKIYFMEGYL